MKKVLLSIIVVGMVVFSFSATKITFWYAIGGTSGESFKNIVEEFNSMQDDVEVKLVYTGSYADTAQKVTAAMATNTLPNGGIIPAGPIFTGVRGNYVLLEYMLHDPEFDMNDFYPAMWEYSKYEGKICAIPYNISTPLLYYNKDLMKDLGLDPDIPPSTWEELLEAAKTITKDINKDGIPEIWGFDTNDPVWIFKAFLRQNENEIIETATLTPLFDTPSGIETAEFWKKLIDEKAMPVGQHSLAENLFLGGRLGFFMGSSNRIGKWKGKTDFDWGVAYLPAGKVRAVPLGGAVAVLFPENAEKDETTYRLIKWITSPENVAKFTMETGYLPIRKSALELPVMKKFMAENPEWKIAFEQLEFSFAYWHFDEMGTMDNLIWEALEKIERNVSSPEEAMKWLTKTLHTEIEANR